MNRILVTMLCLFVATGAPASAGGGMIAVPPPTSALEGRVTLKDGVSAVRQAELELTSQIDGQVYTKRAGRSGRFKVRLPVGAYTLRIRHGMELFESASVYRMPAGGSVRLDFLLLKHFEQQGLGDDRSGPTRDMPDPVPSAPVVVGTVVDLAPAEGGRARGRWVEILAFIGSLLVVAIAAD